jgi:hypothetical protein
MAIRSIGEARRSRRPGGGFRGWWGWYFRAALRPALITESALHDVSPIHSSGRSIGLQSSVLTIGRWNNKTLPASLSSASIRRRLDVKTDVRCSVILEYRL